MKKLLSILLVLFIAVGALTSCDALGGQTPGDRLYRAFTKAEEMMIEDAVGEKIPFLPNDEYYIENTDEGILFYTVGNTVAELSDISSLSYRSKMEWRA